MQAFAEDAARTPVAAHARATQVETVVFADPRMPAVRVVRGGAQRTSQASLVVVHKAPPPQRAAASATILPASVAPSAPAVTAAPVFRATAFNTEIVTFGDGRGESVHVVRGYGPEPAIVRPDESPQAEGRVETVRFGGLDAPTVNVVRGAVSADQMELFSAARGGELDRVAFAVDGAESGHGSNLAMWRPEVGGPQGPMQVSAAAAFDVGGGDRFDVRQNRLMGRAYLALLYQRYGNWPDAIAAYNWGPGNLDQWIATGRRVDGLPLETARYLLRVLHEALLLGPS
jgi:hypothetical protein